ncbi:MAG: protein kinase [Deltaproteobacteria bacterium]|nr:protein kinase [Deltaproteobacteria bacterium]
MGSEDSDLAIPVTFDDSQPVPVGLPTGTSLKGGRYEVAGFVGAGPFADLYTGKDTVSGQRVELRVLSRELLSDPQAEQRLHAALAAAARVSHKNIAKALDLASHAGQAIVVSELVGGRSVRELVVERAAQGDRVSPKTTYNIIAHAANGLAHAHGTLFHGALSARNLMIDRAGRVKITELGLVYGFPRGAALLATSQDGSALAPEVARTESPRDARADVYSLGIILLELLLGRPVTHPPRVPRELLPQEIKLLERCLAPDPQGRLGTVTELKEALLLSLKAREAKMQARGPSVQSARRAEEKKPARGPKPTVRDENEEKWLIQKDKLDFGPFTFAQVKEQITRDEVLPDHLLIDNMTGKRCAVEDHPDLHDLVMSAAARRDDARRANAEAAVIKREKRKGTALYGVIAVSVLALLLGAYFGARMLQAASKKGSREITSLEGAERDLKLDLKPRPRKQPRKKGTAVASKTKGSDPGFDDSVDLGNAAEGDDESARLSDDQLNSVLSRHQGALAKCLMGSGERNADIEFIVRGNGKVSDVRVNGETGSPLAACVRGKMQAMQFPTFNGPRTKASFSMGY